MNEQKKPLLSIGMIFRNDIRSLERCLKALEPLRQAVPCELVMADTGSDDGSRAVAERYADVLFDFPWVDDFSAARNAVLERCKGKWYFAIDADEYLDPDITQLVQFLNTRGRPNAGVGLVVQRNYGSYEMEEDNYADFMAERLLRLSTGLRYKGTIHEYWPYDHNMATVSLSRIILRHDGYVDLYGERGRAKRERNLALLRKELEKEPENLLRHLQYLESARTAEDYPERLRTAMRLTKEKKPGWNVFGPPVFRYAVIYAQEEELPELERWAREANELFPDSYFTRIDVAFLAAVDQGGKNDYEGCISWGEKYLTAYQDFVEGKDTGAAIRVSTIKYTDEHWSQLITILLARCYFHQGSFSQCVTALKNIDYSSLNESQVEVLTKMISDLHSTTQEDTVPIILSLWEGIGNSGTKAERLREVFCQTVETAFAPDTLRGEKWKESFSRSSYSMLLPLRDSCVFGTAAAILDTDDRAEIETLLAGVKDWSQLPASALAHAFEIGVIPASLRLEEMDILAGRLARTEGGITQAAISVGSGELPSDILGLTWARALVLAAIRTCKWQDEKTDMELCRAFTHVMAAFLPRYYGAETLREKNIRVLSPYFRFGWYCVQAFEALDNGDTAGYVRLLRAGLELCSEAKPVVEFLLRHTPQLQEPKPSAELLALAERVRTMLSAYAPDDPAVAALKSSPAYQKVAHLIEGVDGGGLPS